MKNLPIKIVVFLLAFTSAAFAAPMSVDVLVSDASGKVAYQGTTKGDGTFETGKLQPGKYVVQFRSKSIRGDHTIVVSAGSKKVRAESVSASRFGGGGVAMKVDVGAGVNIAGQVASVPTGMVAGDSRRAHDASIENMQRVQERGGEGAMVIPGRP